MTERERRPLAARYGVAVAAAVAALAVLSAPAVGKGAAYVPLLAVIVSAWYGGLGAGLLATGLTATAYAAWTVSQSGSFPAWRVEMVGLFVASGVFVTRLVEGLHAARRRAEASQRWLTAVLTSIGDAVIATDEHGRVAFTNPVAQALTGWPEPEAQGKPLGQVFRIVSESTGEPAADPVARVLREGVTVGLANHTALVGRDGSSLPIADSAAPIRDEGGAVTGAVLVFRDVTPQRRAEQELLAADRRKDEFLAMLAHELRNPLSAISDAVRLAGTPSDPGGSEWARDVLERQVRHLTRLIDDLLDVSRITRGKIELRREVLELAPVLRAAVEAAGPLVHRRGHRLTVDVPDPGPRVEGDATRLEQVFVNLLTNAAKYTDPGGEITLSARAEGGEVAVTVRDNGVGITPEQIPGMFELFAQGDRSLARSEGGLGIGLTLVRSLAEMHGGSIAARSGGRGLGSEFTVRLPVHAGALTATAARARTPATRANGSDRRRVLVVDDNADIASGLSRLLGSYGHEVRACADGPSALLASDEFRPEVVLLDIGLPGMDGYEVSRRLRALGLDDVLIVAVSGYGQDEDRRLARAAGVDHHMVKPVDHDALLRLVARGRHAAPDLDRAQAD